jgi:hypothetical protein
VTLHATAADVPAGTTPQHVDVHVTSGSLAVKVREDIRHVRSFWSQLGAVLDQMERAEKDAAAARVKKEGGG